MEHTKLGFRCWSCHNHISFDLQPLITIQFRIHNGDLIKETQTLIEHHKRLQMLNRLEAQRKECAPTHWGQTDQNYEEERKAIQALSIGEHSEPTLQVGDPVTFRVKDNSAEDFAQGLDEEELQELDKQEATIRTVEIDGGLHKQSAYDIEFPNGTILHAICGHNLD